MSGPNDTLSFEKLGGSVITDKHREAVAHVDIISRLAGEVARARAARPELQLVIGHGSGSFGHFVGHRYQTHLGLAGGGGWEGYAQTGAAASRLNRIVADLFLESGVPVVSLQPSASALCRDGELCALAVEPVRTLLDAGLVPLVYGDVALDEARGFTIISTETIFAYLAQCILPVRIVLVGAVGGVYTADPLIHPEAKLIPEITSEDITEVERTLGGSHGVDVTGGMGAKVRAMYELVKAHPGLRVQIISGLEIGLLTKVLVNHELKIGSIIQ